MLYFSIKNRQRTSCHGTEQGTAWPCGAASRRGSLIRPGPRWFWESLARPQEPSSTRASGRASRGRASGERVGAGRIGGAGAGVENDGQGKPRAQPALLREIQTHSGRRAEATPALAIGDRGGAPPGPEQVLRLPLELKEKPGTRGSREVFAEEMSRTGKKLKKRTCIFVMSGGG